MSTTYGLSTANNGLLFSLDSGTVKCYPGTGTSATDLSGNNNTCTLSNITHTAGPTGYWSFNGSTSSMIAAVAPTFDLSKGVSMEMVFKSSDIQSRAQGFMQFNAGNSYINFYSSGAGSLRWETWINASTGQGGAFYTPATLTNNSWYHAVGTYSNSGAAILYINGVQAASASYSSYVYSSSFNASLIIGQYAGYMSGNIPVAKMYNRALTAAEVLQNFNALRGRYGL
jgi:hypothetical protein